MRVKDIMEAAVEAAEASMPASVAWNRMRRRGLRMFAIVDSTGVIGLVTREQLSGRGGPLKRRDRTLGDFVRTGGVSTTPECTVTHAAAMLHGQIEGCVPVLRGTQLVGVLTVAQLLERLMRSRHERRVRGVQSAHREPAPVENSRCAS